MVRILSGEFRSRQLHTIPDDESTRPFLSRVKESIFGMLHEWFADARVLDLFAGSGSMLRACGKHGRRFIGLDNNAEYCRRMVGGQLWLT